MKREHFKSSPGIPGYISQYEAVTRDTPHRKGFGFLKKSESEANQEQIREISVH